MAEEIVAGFRINAEKYGNDKHDSPGENGGHTRISANHRKKLARRLASRNPPGNHGGNSSGEREGQQFARKPTFNFWPRFFPNKVIPSEQSDGEEHPTVKRGFLVKPPPGAEDEMRVLRHSKARKQEYGDEAVGRNGNEKRDQTHQLEPIASWHTPAPGAHGLFRQEI